MIRFNEFAIANILLEEVKLKLPYEKYRGGIFRLILVLSILMGFISAYLYRSNLNIRKELSLLEYNLRQNNHQMLVVDSIRLKKLESQLHIYHEPFEALRRVYSQINKLRKSESSDIIRKLTQMRRTGSLDGLTYASTWMDCLNFILGFGFLWIIFGTIIFIKRGFKKTQLLL